jgi:hypothetical protein
MDSSNFKLKLPQLFSYHNAIKSPDELGASDAGNNATLKRDSDAIFGYIGGIFSGNRNNVFKTNTPMIGDKQFFNTGIQCTKQSLNEINNNNISAVNVSSSQLDNNKLTDRYSYIDNITKTPNNQPVGLLYQVLDDVMDLNPTDMFSSITEPPYPQCIPVTLKTIKQNVNYDIETGFETHYVIVNEIEKIDPCNFEDGVNPVVKEKTNAVCDLKNSKQTSIFETYNRNRNNTRESFSNINYPKNHLIQLYIFFVLILFFYLFYRLNYK